MTIEHLLNDHGHLLNIEGHSLNDLLHLVNDLSHLTNELRQTSRESNIVLNVSQRKVRVKYCVCRDVKKY